MICLFFASAFSTSTCSGKTYTIIDTFVTVHSNFENECPGAETLIIKDAMSITFQSGDAFRNSKLKVIKMTSDMSITLQSDIFSNLASLQTVTLASGGVTIQSEVFKGSGVQTVTLKGDTSVTIQESAFANCKSLETVEMSANSVSIQGDSFKGSSVQSVTLTGDTSATIQGASFANCKSLETVEMSARSVTIQGTSFHYCSSLNSVKLTGSTSVTIQNNPFCGCTNLKGNIEAITDKFTFQESSAFQCDGSSGDEDDTSVPSVPSPTPAPIKYTISATVNGEFRPLEISIVNKDGYGTGCTSAQLLEKYDITITSDIPDEDIPEGYKIALNYDKTKYEVDKTKLPQKMSDAIEEKQISGSGDGGKKGGGISMTIIIGIVVAVVVVVVIIIVVVVVVKKKNKKQTSDAEANEEQLP
ncbi:hypothetical protein M9Y10_008730 [Tritrichomonas musculus]|uniref:Surface antigen BspA-like n=1 Tax=Tritrichomonas musculus TaxID=1915356 RepID=A0ABR2J0T8_9EUKA